MATAVVASAGEMHVGWSHRAGAVAVVVDDAPCAVDVESLVEVRDPPLTC